MSSTVMRNQLSFLRYARIGTPLLVIVLLAMVVLPLPPILLDLAFTFNISLALMVILAAIYAKSPLEFAVFPTLLLISTLLRLALNIASTRVVLIEGHAGSDAAGQVIKSFGEVVIGGNYAVGLVVFAILVIINFVVVTKGSGRISEVSARFTLDALPGKQMAIDADLNTGVINQEEARKRRAEVAQEADFYGSMDGASKFVRGDAIAGIIILVINIVGGLFIGILQHNLAFSDAMQIYALLTIGDGLVAQIPSLLLSTAAAIMVTRVSTQQDMSEQMVKQLLQSPRTLAISAGILLFLGLMPGMPHFAFLLLGVILAGFSYWQYQKSKDTESLDTEIESGSEEKQNLFQNNNKIQMNDDANAQEDTEQNELSWDDVPVLDTIGLEVGYRLISLVDRAQNGEIISRIKGVRKKLSQELGFLIPSVHIRDNLDLPPNAYRISVMGVTVGEAHIYPEKDLAINPGKVFGKLEGIETIDPAFGLEAIWIDKSIKEQAHAMGYTVVDASTVVATHLSQLLQEHASHLIGHEEVQHLLDILSKSAPKLVEDLVPKSLTLGVVVKVLQNLLLEHVPIRDLRTIAEALAECAHQTKDPNLLTSHVRIALGGMIFQQINDVKSEMPVITLEPGLEQLLQQSVQVSGNEAGIEPGLASKLQTALRQFTEKQEIAGKPAVLLVSAPLRAMLSKFVRYGISRLNVLSYQEIPDNKQIQIVNTIGQ